MSSDFSSRDDLVERGSMPLDIDNIHMLLQVEQEQVQKKTFTNWVNAQLAKRWPSCLVVDLFSDFRDGSKLLDLLEVMSGQRISRERGRGTFRHRSNIEKALSFLKKKSIKLVNINIPDIIDGKPSIILGLVWTIILQYHIEELAGGLSFSSRQSSMESLTSLDSRSSLSSCSACSSPVPPRGSPLHKHFRVSAKKALLLWVREQCHRAGCTVNVKDFKASWRSGVVFLAILYALRPDLVDPGKAGTRSNKHNLEEAFSIAEKELRIPRLLEPDDVDVRDPDEKSIMTYVAQFLQYSRELPTSEDEAPRPTLPRSPSPVRLPVHYTPAISASPLRQATPDRKAKEVTCWLVQAHSELLEGWDSTEGESYSERYHVFHTFLVSFNEQRRPIMPLLTVMRRNPKLSEEQRALRQAWDVLAEKLREYKTALDVGLPVPLDSVARWLLKTEGVLADEEDDPTDHSRAADRTGEKRELLKICLEEMPQHLKAFQSFQNLDEFGNMLVPADKMDELKRRFTSVRVSAKYHDIKLEYRQHRHSLLDLLGQISSKVQIWKRPYISPEAVRVLLQEWHELVITQELPSLLETTLDKLKLVSEKYSRKSALASDYHHVSQQVKQLEKETAGVVDEVSTAKSNMGRVLSAWDSYNDCLSSLQAWLEQGSARRIHDQSPQVTSDSVAEWGSRQTHLNEVGNVLIESTDPQTSRSLAEELRRLNMHWADFSKKNTCDGMARPPGDIQAKPQDVQALIIEATLIFKEPVEAMAGPLRTYRKRIQFLMRRIKDMDLEALYPSTECPADQLQRLNLAIPEVMQSLLEAEQVCAEMQNSVSGLDSRLAELLHWETEARELYQLLRATERQHQAQDPRARVLISRGLQLEGQVVTEEQDLQVTVMTSQKSSPIQCLHASAMQDRVRAAVAQSQEAVGMLSSLGARRDRSRSPPEASPPSKVFKQAEEKPQLLMESDVGHPTQNPEMPLVSHPSHEIFVPKIVLPEYREEKITSTPMGYTYAEAVMYPRAKSPLEGQAQALLQGAKQQTQEQTWMQMDQQPLQQERLKNEMEIVLQEQDPKEQLPQEPQQQDQLEQEPPVQDRQQAVQREYAVQKRVISQMKGEPQKSREPLHHKQTLPSPEETPVTKPLMTSQKLQSRKAQAMKNRPWLQKPATGEHKDSAPDPEQDSTQTRQAQPQSDKETASSIPTASPQLEAKAKATEQPQKQRKRQTAQLQHGEQQKQGQQSQQLGKDKQEEFQIPLLRPAEQELDAAAKSQPVIMSQPCLQTKAEKISQSQMRGDSEPQAAVFVQVQPTSVTNVQQPQKIISQTGLTHDQQQTRVLQQSHGPSVPHSVIQPQTHLQLQSQAQKCVPDAPQSPMQSQGLAHGAAVAQVHTSSLKVIFSILHMLSQWYSTQAIFPRVKDALGLKLEPLPQCPSHIHKCKITLKLAHKVDAQPHSAAESPDLCNTPPALAQASPQAYTEAYSKAQALARNGFEEAKYCLQEHILETIQVFEDKRISPEQASVKEETLRSLDTELLEEFLRAAKGMEAFCTPSQLRDMEMYTRSVRTQWESCISADGGFAEAGRHLEALKGLCGTLSPEDAHRLAQTQLRECKNRLAALQRQFSGDQDAQLLPDSRIPVAFSENLTMPKEPTRPSEEPQMPPEVFPASMATASVEEGVPKKEALERYESCKKALVAQLAKNGQSIKDVPSDSVSLKGLHTRLQEIQFLRQETESLWSEYSNQFSQHSQLSGNTGLEHEKLELQEQWRSQQCSLQRRGSSLGAALRQIDSTENHMVDFTDRLDRYLRQPKHITSFTLANTNILKDIKDLDDNIQSELDQLSRLDPGSSDLDPRDCFPLSREVETHRTSLDQLRQQVQKSEAAARALDRFLMSLRTVDEDISGVQDAPCSEARILQECRTKLVLIRQSIDSLKEKAPQLDVLLQGARLTVTRDGVPASCLDMVSVLLRRLEEADGGLACQQEANQKETESKSMGVRKRSLLGELRRLQETIERQGLKEPTIPAVQHRLRALSDSEGQLQAQHTKLQNLRELQDKQGGGENLFEELEAQWKETQRAFSDRKKQCSILLELLKRFQGCRGPLTGTMQRAETTIGDRASYMGKENLQRSVMKVCDIQEELTGLKERIEEVRALSRQLQSQLKKFPECSDVPMEAEADALMDNWLDITEKTDAYMDNLQVALELWEKQLVLGVSVDGWAGAKLALFAESHPFHNEQQVLDMRDEIHANEENLEHFHRKSKEIQKMLQSQEPPLELQVMETQLRKRMEQVKELFTDCTDVFEELVAVKTHLAEKLQENQSAVERLQGSVSKVDASQAKAEAQIQRLCNELDSQGEQAEAVMKEVGLVSSVASPRVVEALSEDCVRLREAILRTKDMIQLKREERDKGILQVIQDEKQSFQGWFQDLQRSANECFENPESRTDAETSLRRLEGFLKSKDVERRLEQLKDQLERGAQQVPPQQLAEFTVWLKEQQEEGASFRDRCCDRQEQMESLLSDLNSLQKQHDSFCDWLQTKEKQSMDSDKVKHLLQDLQDESSRAEALADLLASLRRRGVRAESLLKGGDNVIQRYRNLEARLRRLADAQTAREGQLYQFNAQAECTRTWITDLLLPSPSSGADTQTPEVKSRAQAILHSKPEGNLKLDDLRRRSETLCGQEDLKKGRKEAIEQSIRETEDRWRKALQTAEEALSEVETPDLLDKDVDAFKSQVEDVQSWIRDQEQNLDLLDGCMQVEEKPRTAQATLSAKPAGDSKLQSLKQRCQNLSDRADLDGIRRGEIQDTVRHTEERWRKVLLAAGEAFNKAEAEASAERDFGSFTTQSESILSWIKEQRQKLSECDSHMKLEERMQVTQAVMTSGPEGESRVLDLERRGETLSERLGEIRKAEVRQLVEKAVQQWKAALQAARQVELRTLLEDFDTQHLNAQYWTRERQQELQAAGVHTPPEHRGRSAETILSSRPEGDRKVNNLRRRGQTLCEHPDADEGRVVQVQQAVRDMEERWRTVLQDAKELEDAAGEEMTQRIERRTLELSELDSHERDTGNWLTDLQQQLDTLDGQTTAEDRLQSAQAILSTESEGVSKLNELRRRCQSLCRLDLDKDRKQELQQKVKGAEERWTRVMQKTKQHLDQAERQCALEGQLKGFKDLSENTKAWMEDKLQSLVSVGRKDPEETVKTAQTVLSCKPEGDAKLAELRRRSQGLSDQQNLEDGIRKEVQKTVNDSEEQWRTVLQSAESALQQAEVQYALSREVEAFRTQAKSTRTWVKELQQQAESKGSGTQGTRAQIEDRLNTAQAILNSRSNGEAQVRELERRAQSLCEQKDMEEGKKLEVQQMVRDTEQQWRTVLLAAEETQRRLKAVAERLLSCQQHRDQAAARLSELQNLASRLPRVFPWPGLGERRQVLEQARTLLDQSTALALVLPDVRMQAAALFEITQDGRWTDPSWETKEASIPILLKELTEAAADLDQSILAERCCTQLLEQHEAAQDWLREQVKGLGARPADRLALHGAINTLKALLQTVDREQREMKELDSARDSLLSICTPGGRDALTLEVSHLHDLCATSEQEVRERLMACEIHLGELNCQLARKAQGLKERAAALQWELRSLDQALGYSEPQNNVGQLQQHWHSLQNCEKSLEDLGVKVHDLCKEVKATPATDELPTETITLVESLCQKHDSIKCRLGEHQSTCSTNVTRCLMDCLHALQEWKSSKPPEFSPSLQVALEEGEKLRVSLQDVLSHRLFLKDCLMPVLFDKLDQDGSETLREVQAHMASLSQCLQELKERSKQKMPDLSHGKLEKTKTSEVAQRRKSKQSPPKKHDVKRQQNIPPTEKSVDEEMSVSAELENESKIMKSTNVDQSRTEPTKKESQETKYDSKCFTAQSSADRDEAYRTQPADGKPVSAEPTASSERKAKTSATDTEPTQSKVEIETTEPETSGTAAVVPEQPKTAVMKQREVLPPKQEQEHDKDPTTPEFGQKQGKTADVEEPRIKPPKRKSKSTQLPFTAANTGVPGTKKDLRDVLGEKTLLPIRKKSKNGDISKTSETITDVISPDVKPEQRTDSQASPSPAVVTTPTQNSVKLSPTKERSKGLRLSEDKGTKDVADDIKDLDEQKSENESILLKETNPIPSKKMSKSAFVDTLLEPVIATVVSLELKEAIDELDRGSASLPAQVVTGINETAIGNEFELMPTTRKAQLSPELSHKNVMSPMEKKGIGGRD
ncbi:nesprin-2-like [Brachionichthys hirsutus]|uniref:nesprin-2-like n=1 Tax=Brachionichthys hirsutus TaxID=412623 RepID=UPI0036047E88